MSDGIIYKAISPSGKVYIGQTTDTLYNRMRKHNSDAKKHTYAFANAIRKYGVNNFKWIVIHEDVPEYKLNDLEIYEIRRHDSFLHGYNSTEGGDFNPMEYEINRKKVSARTRGIKHKINQNGERNHMSVLNWDVVHKIREEYRLNNVTHFNLSKKYNVSRKTIGNVINNKSWYDEEYVVPKINRRNKLSHDVVRCIREKYKLGNVTYKDISIEYNVSFQLIGLIITNKIWCKNEES